MDRHRHLGQFNVTEELLKQVLQLSEKTVIVDIHSVPYHPNLFTIVVEHPRLPETPEGMEPLYFKEEIIMKGIGRKKDE